MRFPSRAGAAVVCLFSGLIVPGYAQRDDKQGDKQGGRQSQGHGQQAKPQHQDRAPQAQQQRQREQQAQPQQRAQQPPRDQSSPELQREQQRAQQSQRAQQPQEQQQRQAQPGSFGSQHPQRSRQQAQSWQQQRGWLQQGGWQGHDTFQQSRSRNWNSDNRNWAQRGGYGGYYISQNTFNLYFGRQHFFRLQRQPVMYLGYPRFEYGGSSFLLLDPWPQNWSKDWFASDDVYIDYDDGYYLYDRNYPRQRLAITILI